MGNHSFGFSWGIKGKGTEKARFPVPVFGRALVWELGNRVWLGRSFNRPHQRELLAIAGGLAETDVQETVGRRYTVNDDRTVPVLRVTRGHDGRNSVSGALIWVELEISADGAAIACYRPTVMVIRGDHDLPWRAIQNLNGDVLSTIAVAIGHSNNVRPVAVI